ncbi:hypothetical protein [Roseovarius sp. A-2]|uniref:hypothetical protein n=1 Tax=Roseovarius sp. A-2 TaxID=1570360 RepID=UPI00111A07F2|nr:hypothetical protein [Roseovarius sp. A-2]
MAILNSFLKLGRPPEIETQDAALLEDLQQRDLIVVNGNAIQHAYPIAASAMPHSVTIAGVKNFNVCAR